MNIILDFVCGPHYRMRFMKNKEIFQRINIIVEELRVVTEKMESVVKLLSEINDLSENMTYQTPLIDSRFEKVYKLFFVGISEDTLSDNLREIKDDFTFKVRFLKAFDRREFFDNRETRDMLEECDYWSGDWSASQISTITKRLNRLKCKEKLKFTQCEKVV